MGEIGRGKAEIERLDLALVQLVADGAELRLAWIQLMFLRARAFVPTRYKYEQSARSFRTCRPQVSKQSFPHHARDLSRRPIAVRRDRALDEF